MSKVIRISNETWERLGKFATPFKASDLGAPEKVIQKLLDRVEEQGVEEDEE